MKSPKHLLVLSMAALVGTSAFAHCDGWDGPVVLDAQKALAKGDLNLVLLWVQKGDEAAIREAFARTLEVRKAGGESQRLADQFFFETLVRLHRAGEGASYLGLKPAGRDLGPAIPAGDQALETGDLKPVWKLLSDTAHQRLHNRFDEALKAKAFPSTDLEAGRKFVAAYVSYIHYVEGLYGAAKGSAHGGEGAAPAGASCDQK